MSSKHGYEKKAREAQEKEEDPVVLDLTIPEAPPEDHIPFGSMNPPPYASVGEVTPAEEKKEKKK